MSIIENIDEKDFIIYKDEDNLNEKSRLGVEKNRIIEVPNFVSPDTAKAMTEYFECKADMWGPIAFYGSSGMGLMPGDEDLDKFNLDRNFFPSISLKFQEAIEKIFDKKVKPNTSHAQKWDVGGFASVHSDNSDFDGNPNSFQINKYVGILYLNDDFEGGELYFPEHNISFKPNAYSLICFPGGVENIHGVSEITKGTRYTMVSFWDYSDADYSEQLKLEWEEEIKNIRKEQEQQREEWAKGNKFA